MPCHRAGRHRFLGGIMNSMLALAMAVSLAALQLWKRSRIPACAHRRLERSAQNGPH